jgi:hypothetical protein
MKRLKPGDEVDVSLSEGGGPVRRIVAAVEGDVVRMCTRLEYEAALAQNRRASVVGSNAGPPASNQPQG